MQRHSLGRRLFAGAGLSLVLLAAAPAGAQLADKPSALTAARRGSALAEPHSPRNPAASLEKLASRAEFDGIARIYDAGTPRAMPHVLFAVDRVHGGRLYFVNTRRFKLHEDFLRAQYLVPNLDHKAMAGYYTRPERRFLLGTVGYQPDLKQWVYEFWEGDRLDATLLGEAQKALSAGFFAPLAFKANSAQQEAAAREAGAAFVTEQQILGERSFIPLNTGRANGRLRLVADIEAETEDDIEPTDVVVLRDVPLAIPPVAGVLTEQPSTALSHVNLLVKGWGVPNAYVKDAAERLKPLDGQWVTLQVGDGGYTVEPAARPDRVPAQRVRAAQLRAPDLRSSVLVPLDRLKGADASCGAKAARLGDIEAARRAGQLAGVAPVPDGFCIPYAQYTSFIRQPQARHLVAQALATPGFERSRAVRRQALEGLRRQLVELPVEEAQAAVWWVQWREQLGSAGVFVRSSSNSEDLAHFSGAGLYTTVPNVTRPADLVRAVKTVWASVFNFEAFEARRQAGLADELVAMGVFVQRAVDSVSSGVMVTRDPFDASHRGAVYVSAKRGIGIKVVEGRRVAEQSMFDARSGAVRRLSRSAEDAELKLVAGGGVQERPLEGSPDVLAEATVKALARVGLQLKALRRGVDQDIEWAIDPQGRIVVLQSRPYIERKVL